MKLSISKIEAAVIQLYIDNGIGLSESTLSLIKLAGDGVLNINPDPLILVTETKAARYTLVAYDKSLESRRDSFNQRAGVKIH